MTIFEVTVIYLCLFIKMIAGEPILTVPTSGVVGENATFTCEYPGFDASQPVLWGKKQQPISTVNRTYEHTFTNNSFSLTIIDVKLTDAGLYRCNYNFEYSNEEHFRVESITTAISTITTAPPGKISGQPAIFLHSIHIFIVFLSMWWVGF